MPSFIKLPDPASGLWNQLIWLVLLLYFLLWASSVCSLKAVSLCSITKPALILGSKKMTRESHTNSKQHQNDKCTFFKVVFSFGLPRHCAIKRIVKLECLSFHLSPIPPIQPQPPLGSGHSVCASFPQRWAFLFAASPSRRGTTCATAASQAPDIIRSVISKYTQCGKSGQVLCKPWIETWIVANHTCFIHEVSSVFKTSLSSSLVNHGCFRHSSAVIRNLGSTRRSSPMKPMASFDTWAAGCRSYCVRFINARLDRQLLNLLPTWSRSLDCGSHKLIVITLNNNSESVKFYMSHSKDFGSA